MSKVENHLSLAQMPLVRELSTLGSGRLRAPKKGFADWMAEAIDLGEAIELADFLKTVDRVVTMTGAKSGPADTIFAGHVRDMQAVINASFEDQQTLGRPEPAVRQGFRLPPVSAALVTSADAYAPYKRFYALHQSEMERRIALLKHDLHLILSSHSAAFAQLVAIDKALEPILIRLARKALTAAPRLLGGRFDQLRQQQREADLASAQPSTPDDWLSQQGWLRVFYADLARTLRAELALRLYPLRGLVETVGETLPSVTAEVRATMASATCQNTVEE